MQPGLLGLHALGPSSWHGPLVTCQTRPPDPWPETEQIRRNLCPYQSQGTGLMLNFGPLACPHWLQFGSSFPCPQGLCHGLWLPGEEGSFFNGPKDSAPGLQSALLNLYAFRHLCCL